MDAKVYSREFVLEYPLRNGNGEEVAVLHLRRPRLRDYDSAKRQAGEHSDGTAELISTLAFENVLPEDAADLDIADLSVINDWFKSLVSAPRRAQGRDLKAAQGAAGEVVPVSAKRDR